ncbi:MAG TPA: polysaccharide deacetylase family protein [Tissierellia bacterium]|nr:polysaccharide deacetylase family protein [Tissierellia bacterium]
MKSSLLFLLLLLLVACQSNRVETRRDSVSYTAEETTVQDDETMLVGQEKHIRDGVPGIKEIVTQVTLQGNKVISEEVVSETIIEEAVSAIIARGVREIKQRQVTLSDRSVETITQDDSTLEAGQEQVLADGNPGQTKITYEDTYIKGRLSSSKILRREVIIAAKPKLIAVGTKESAETGSDSYVVQSGDTLYRIAVNFNTTVDAIKRLNDLSSNTISVGQRLKLPSEAETAGPQPPSPTPPRTGDYGAIPNDDISWWFQPGPPSSISGEVAQIISDHRVYWKLSPGRNVVYLTFDEGYEYGNNTSKILATLKDKGVKATFFITGGYLDAHPELVQAMENDGHQLANHTIDHYRAPSALSESTDKFISDVIELNDRVPAMTKLHRPPEGGYSQRSLQILDDLGYTTVFWSFAYRDWLTNDQPDPTWAKQHILNNLFPGSILLLHAVSDTNVAILGEVIDGIHDQGYTIELLPTD